MKRIPCVFLLLLALGVGIGGNFPLRGQDGQLTLEPPLSEDLPFETLPDGVHLEFPVLLNDHTILRPEAILRFVYLDPNAISHGSSGSGESGPGAGFHSHVGPGGALLNDSDNRDQGGGKAGGWGDSNGNEVAGIYDDRKSDDKRRKAELENEVWKQKDLFDDALEHATELGTVLVYSVPPQGRPLTATLDLPEGMLLGEVDGHVRVLGLKEESRAFVGGVRPGDEIQSMNAGAPLKSLGDFMTAFAATKRQAKVTGHSTYSMAILRPSTGEAFSAQIAAPPSIPSFFNSINSSPADTGTDKDKTP